MRLIALVFALLTQMTGSSASEFDEDEVFDALDSWAVELDAQERGLNIVEKTLLETWNSSGFMDGNGPVALVESHSDSLREIAQSFERIGFGELATSLLDVLAAWEKADGDESRIDPSIIETADAIWFDDYSPRYIEAIYTFVEQNGGVPNP